MNKEQSKRLDAKLVEQYKQTGNIDFRDQIIINLQPYVRRIASQYASDFIELEDLIQEGNIGLIYAIESYRLGSKASLATYAFNRIKLACARYARRNCRIVTTPEYAIRLGIMNITNLIYQRKGEQPTVEEIAKLVIQKNKKSKRPLAIKKETIMALIEHANSIYISKDKPEFWSEFSKLQSKETNVEIINELLDIAKITLNEENLSILDLMMNGLNFSEIGNIKGCSRELISQKFKQIVKELKRHPEIKELKDEIYS